MSKTTTTATTATTNSNVSAKFNDLLTKSTDCVLTVRTLDDKGVADIVNAYKRSAWDFAKICYLFNKVQGIKLDTLSERFGIDTATIGKHAVNVAWLLERYGKGFDAYAELYSISKVDLLRKACDLGCFKKTSFEDAIQKKRSDIEKAIAKVKKGDNADTDTDNADTNADTVVITMTDNNGTQITREISADTWALWVKEYEDSKAE